MMIISKSFVFGMQQVQLYFPLQLLSTCSYYGTDCVLKFNAAKSNDARLGGEKI